MNTLLSTKASASPYVNAVCVEVQDMGVVETPYGSKPQAKFMFESDERDEHGRQRRFVRMFNKYFNDKSALSIAVKAWSGRDLPTEMENFGEVDLQSFVEDQVRLKLEPVTTKSGKPFDKIVEILPPGEVHVQPSYEEDND